jgi:hypothetical protein
MAFFVLQQIKVAQASPAQATLLAPRLTPCLNTASLIEVLCGLQEGKGGRVRTPRRRLWLVLLKPPAEGEKTLDFKALRYLCQRASKAEMPWRASQPIRQRGPADDGGEPLSADAQPLGVSWRGASAGSGECLASARGPRRPSRVARQGRRYVRDRSRAGYPQAGVGGPRAPDRRSPLNMAPIVIQLSAAQKKAGGRPPALILRIDSLTPRRR